MGQIIKILNCNCIDRAEIEIEQGTLNIKYGANGTGKSTISKAIYAKASDNETLLKELKTYGKDEIPTVENLTYQKVKVFDENYVNAYLFEEKSFLENSYRDNM